MDEESAGPDIGQTLLRRETRVRKQVKYLVPTHKGQSYDQGVAFHQVSYLRVSERELKVSLEKLDTAQRRGCYTLTSMKIPRVQQQ